MFFLSHYLSREILFNWISAVDLMYMSVSMCNDKCLSWFKKCVENGVADFRSIERLKISNSSGAKHLLWLSKLDISPCTVNINSESIPYLTSLRPFRPKQIIVDNASGLIEFPITSSEEINISDTAVGLVSPALYHQVHILSVYGSTSNKNTADFLTILEHTRSLRKFSLVGFNNFAGVSTESVKICELILSRNKFLTEIDLIGLKAMKSANTLHINSRGLSDEAVFKLVELFPNITKLKLHKCGADTLLMEHLLLAYQHILVELEISQGGVSAATNKHHHSVAECIDHVLKENRLVEKVSLKHLSDVAFGAYAISQRLWEKIPYVENFNCSLCSKSHTLVCNLDTQDLACILYREGWLKVLKFTSVSITGSGQLPARLAASVVAGSSHEGNLTSLSFSPVTPVDASCLGAVLINNPHLTYVELQVLQASNLITLLSMCTDLQTLKCRQCADFDVFNVLHEELRDGNKLQTLWLENIPKSNDALLCALLRLVTWRCRHISDVMLNHLLVAPDQLQLALRTSAPMWFSHSKDPMLAIDRKTIINTVSAQDFTFTSLMGCSDFKRFAKLTTIDFRHLSISDAEWMQLLSHCKHFVTTIHIENCEFLTAVSLEFMVKQALNVKQLIVGFSRQHITAQNMHWVAMALANRGSRRVFDIHTNGFRYTVAHHALAIHAVGFPCIEEVVAALVANRYFRVETIKVSPVCTEEELLNIVEPLASPALRVVEIKQNSMLAMPLRSIQLKYPHVQVNKRYKMTSNK